MKNYLFISQTVMAKIGNFELCFKLIFLSTKKKLNSSILSD